MINGTVYLIHLAEPLSGHAEHYLGFTYYPSADRRLAEHQAGHGARMLAVCNERGITYDVVRTWPGSRELERLFKNRKNARRLCPVCRARHYMPPKPQPLC